MRFLRTCGGKMTDTLLEYVQMVYTSTDSSNYLLFDQSLEEETKQYEKWVCKNLSANQDWNYC